MPFLLFDPNLLSKHLSPLRFGIALFLIIAVTIVYLPGVAGPFLFDDVYNIVTNYYVHINSLDWNSLWRAAYSTDTGPFKRPVAMLSFALNSYAAGGVDNPLPFKTVNIAIHAINSLLVYRLSYLILQCLPALPTANRGLKSVDYLPLHLASGAIALFWAIHPIQLTSVLYVVQRMASLATMFMLLGLIGYLAGRLRLDAGKQLGLPLMVSALVVGGVLASLSKEIGILLPLYTLLIEAILFRTSVPWSYWQNLSTSHRRFVTGMLAILGIMLLIGVVDYATHGYANRPFTIMQRTLTGPRILWLYLSLIVAPGLDRFGLNHDDIPMSFSLIDPWTTLPSLLGVIALIAAGLIYRKRYPLMALGVLWFFVGHALESTIFALEIAHEHRNYLPSLGIVWIGAHFFLTVCMHPSRRRLWFALPLFAILIGGICTLRSTQWADLYSLANFEVLHHPNSARAYAFLGQALAEKRDYAGAASAYRRAAELDTSEPANLMILVQMPPALGLSPTPEENREIIRRLVARKITPSALLVLQGFSACILSRCAYTQKPVENWMRMLLKADLPGQDNSYYYHMLGRSLAGQGHAAEALDAFVRSYTLDPRYLNPRIDTVKLLLEQGDLRRAKREMFALIDANSKAHFPRNAEVAVLSAIFEDLKARNLLPD